MAKCSFCGSDIERGTGKIKILKEGKVINLCGTKCEKNMFKLHRVAREMPWTAEYKVAKLVRLGNINAAKKAKEEKKPTAKEEKKPAKKAAKKKEAAK